jgi:hypothetical protein
MIRVRTIVKAMAVSAEGVGTLDGQLRFAIAHRRLIQVGYGGCRRVVEPHDYGVQRGTARLLVYQRHRSGGTPGKGNRGWRLLDVPKIDGCVILEEGFHGSRADSHQHHYAWDVVYARVS